MKLDLSLSQIEDQATREALFRVQEQFRLNPILSGDWKLFDVEFTGALTSTPIKHNLSYIPVDVLVLFSTGNRSFVFKHELFDRENIYLDTSGDCRIKFLAGRVGRG